MMSKDDKSNRDQIQFVCLEELVPQNHLLRQVEAAIDFDFIYELVADSYSHTGRPSIDPVVLVKIVMIQYLFGIRSMRQTIRDIEVNVAYRWFLGYNLYNEIPHFTTFGKNYKTRFAASDLFEQIFSRVLEECIVRGLTEHSVLFLDSTHIKASANRNKRIKVEARKQAQSYSKELRAEIARDREENGKKPFDYDDDDDGSEAVTITQSTTDPDCGMFVKGEHERVFAYSASTICDRHGYVLGYAVTAGNTHDSVSFEQIKERIVELEGEILVTDSAYKTPWIAKWLQQQQITPNMPRTNPRTGKGFFRKYEYVYDEYYDCYLCPENQVLSYSTTNRNGYREYKSKSCICESCPSLKRCTASKNHTKVITRHVWAEALEHMEESRYLSGMPELYRLRKETIERVFADAKEKHGLRYTNYRGLAKVRMQVGLTFACMNLKKLARRLFASSSFGDFLGLCSSFLGFRFFKEDSSLAFA